MEEPPQVVTMLKCVEGQKSRVARTVQLQVTGEQQLPFLSRLSPGRPHRLRRARSPLTRAGQQDPPQASPHRIGPRIVERDAGFPYQPAGVRIPDLKRIGVIEDILVPGAEM